MNDDHASAGEGPNAGTDGKAQHEAEHDSPTKTQDLAKAGRENFDPNEGSD